MNKNKYRDLKLPRVAWYSRCQCGAITLAFENGATNAMYENTFKRLGIDVSNAIEYQKTWACDHCANHYGIDLCECGSGERVGECDCGSHTAHDTLGVQFDGFTATLKAFGIIR